MPCANLNSSRDVTYASYDIAATSPSALGIGLYTVPSNPNQPTKPLPLLYVSPAVARDRSPDANPNNAPGVMSGWYVIVQPGTTFQIHVTKVHNRMPGNPRENRLTTHLFVDGQNVNHSMGYQDNETDFPEHIATGFVEKYSQGIIGLLERTVRKFVFEKVATTEEPTEEGTQCDTGCIRLRVHIGRGILRRRSSVRVRQYKYDSKQVSEKEAAKLGRSLKVRSDGVMTKQRRQLSKYTSVEERELKEAGLCVFVRETGWMRSRRLIDDESKACTYEMYTKLLKNDSGSGTDESAVKEVKPEKQLVGQVGSDGNPSTRKDTEVVDLT